MTEEELGNHVNAWISDALEHDQSYVSQQRALAIQFYDGQCDIEPKPQRSQVVSSDLADALDWIKAGIMRVFCASDKLAIYEPERPEDEADAKDATFAVNSIFRKECDGYRILSDAIHNGLLVANGPIKVWWEGEPEYETETLRGLTQEEYDAILTDPETEEILEVDEYFVTPDGTPIDDEEDRSPEAEDGVY